MGERKLKRKKTILSFIAILAVTACFGISQAKVSAAQINLSQSYKRNLHYWQSSKWTKHQAALKKASRNGMINNQYTDANSNDKTQIIDMQHLSHADEVKLSKFALNTINSARKQMGKKNWYYSNRALHFANDIAKQYYANNRSVWDRTHYYAGINRAAKKHGLNNHYGNIYEDESGLPISSDNLTSKRTMAKAKEQIYFNIKQMLFGGFAGNNMNSLNSYTEWDHAYDLLSMYKYSNTPKEFAISFSNLKNQPDHVSVHMIGVAKRYILNYRKYK